MADASLITVEQLRAFMSAENKLVAAARTDLATVWARLSTLTNEEIRDALLDLFPAIVDKYALISSAHTADLYDALRATAITTAGPPFTALAQPGPNPALLRAAVRETAGKLWGKDREAMVGELSRRLDRYVKHGGRATMLESARRDPAKPRFARVPIGDTCAFCRMLGSRGFVYHTAKTAGTLMQYHPDCDCMIVPGWNGHTSIPGYDPDALLKEWHDSGSLKAMRKGTDENAYQYHGKYAPPEQRDELAKLAKSILPDARVSCQLVKDADQARRQLNTLAGLLDQYPGQRSQIRVITFFPMADEHDPAWGLWTPGKLTLDTATYTTEQFAADLASGFHRAAGNTDPAAYVVAHEFAHCLEHAGMKTQFMAHLQRLTEKMGTSALQAAYHDGLLSQYGVRNWAEALAEGFATMWTSPSLASPTEAYAFELLTGKE